MINVIGIKLNFSNAIYYFSPNAIELKNGDCVIVDTEQGLQYGVCSTNIKKEKKENLVLPLKNVIRIATAEDENINLKNIELSEKSLVDAKKIAKSLDLNMNFVGANYTFDKKQLFISYIADDRIDFRELAKKLAQKYKARIELRQIGVRDKAKHVGGIGPCGLFLCCNSFLNDFTSVSINMAKNQFLALNPNKINGVCGRLLCCLNYENDTYSDLKRGLPKVGNYIETSEGKGKVIQVDIFRKTCKVEISKYEVVEIQCGDLNENSK